MQLNARRLGITVFLFTVSISSTLFAQVAPTSGDVMRDKITKAKALVALRNYSAAIYELEGIRRESSDATVTGVVQVMLIGCFLEQNDYARAQKFLEETYNNQKAGKANANYYKIAAQAVRSARNQIDRYKSFGLSVSDRNLPPIAAADLDKMRETIETVIAQSKTLGADKKQLSDAMALLEESIVVRGNLARDDYDAKRWKEEVADARESLMNSRSQIVNAVDDQPILNNNTTAINNSQTLPAANNPAMIPANGATINAAMKTETAGVLNTEIAKTQIPKANDALITNPVKTDVSNTAANQPNADVKKQETTDNFNKSTTAAQNPPTRSRLAGVGAAPASNSAAQTSANTVAASASGQPVTIGSQLAEYATEKIKPTYPLAAKTIRQTGTVRVDFEVDETGKVDVKNTSGPSMLQRAAVDALKKWKFKPVVRDGQPVKAAGFIDFNFSL